MRLRRLSVKQKLYLLVLGLFIILFLIFTGRLFQKSIHHTEQAPVANEELLILGIAGTTEGLESGEIYTDKGIYSYEGETDLTPYLYQSVQAVTEEDKILHIINLLQREVTLQNCLITENEKDTVTIFSKGFSIALPCQNLQAEFTDEIADVTLTNGTVTKLSVKKEAISGKILSIRGESLEVAGYGTVPLSSSFRFYKTYGNYEEKSVYGLLVGYEQPRLVVAEGEICAAVLPEPVCIERIRILLKTTDFADITHQSVTLKAHGAYEMSYGKNIISVEDGEELNFNKNSEPLREDRVILTPKSQDARLELTSIERSYGAPSYAGSLELVKDSSGVVVINDIDLETYLYSVVPSEMPASYESEALKAQAVCARSYAYGQILLNAYASYGAHVDDSVSYQVYNNLPTDEKVIQAVNETAGQVLTFGEEVANTYYFSTSCGYTTNETIWKNGTLENSYISGKLLNDSIEKLDLTKEKNFREFILKEDYDTYDSGESWYRWDLTVPVEQLTDNVSEIQNIGKVKDIEVTERNEGGVVHRVLITGEKGELELQYEHAIRLALNGKGQTIHRTYGKDAVGGNMLPSGFFVIDRVEEDGTLTGFRFRGGGFGHGAGMSQNGANHMAQAGKTYEEILNLFYEGTNLAEI